jgi:AraC-like DNA-binding protein
MIRCPRCILNGHKYDFHVQSYEPIPLLLFAMDLLSDLFRQAGLRRRLLDLRHIDAATALQFPCDRSVGLHVVLHGAVYLHAPSLPEPLRLEVGDMAVMARGCLHSLCSEASLQNVQAVALAESWPGLAKAAPDTGATHTVISGAYQFWHAPVHPFFQEMPDWFVLRAQDGAATPALQHSLQLLQQEMTLDGLGSESIVYGLLDVIFVLLMRQIVQRQGQERPCWSQSMQDPQVQKAVQALHEDCARQWTLAALASHAGLSRTSLAERFRKSMGNTPLNYLRTVRMQKAMNVLSASERSLEQIAQEVGYQDAFSFSKVFKRTLGVAPRDFRRQDAQDRTLAWRIA